MSYVIIRSNVIGFEDEPTIGGGGGSGEPDINLLAPALDSRIRYTGPSHSYIGEDGLVHQSGLNEWPLEYRGGEAVGRFAPEGAGTNLIKDPFFSTMQVTTSPPVDTWAGQGGGLGTVQPANGINGGPAFNTTAGYYKGALYDVTNAKWIIPDSTAWAPLNLDNKWQRIKQTGIIPADTTARFYPARQDSGNHINYSTAVKAGDITASEFRLPWSGTNNNYRHSWPQLEATSYTTSPMDGPRLASQVLVDTRGASQLLVIYSDGSSDTHDVAGEPEFTLPRADYDWATKYITRIGYIK